ncbi:MAG: hypothetical protein JNL83_15190 [Myxococcales bacterium]|nr:hypothetical protein [Myxococcales bacterium]
MATNSLFRTEDAPRWLGTPSSSGQPAIAMRRPAAPCLETTDARLIAILDAPLAPGETVMAGFARKEHELGAMFARLNVLESRAMHARLANPKAGDELASRFARLTIERRSRLLSFLADARRRAAITGGR